MTDSSSRESAIAKLRSDWDEGVRTRAWYAAVAAGAIISGNQLLGTLADSQILSGEGSWADFFKLTSLRIVFIFPALGLLMALTLFRKRLSLFAIRFIWLVEILAILALCWYTQSRHARIQHDWQVMASFKLAIVVIPCFELGSLALSAGITAFIIAEMAAFWFFYDLGSRVDVRASGDPWIVVIFIISGLLMLWAQQRNRASYFRVHQGELRRVSGSRA